MEISKKKRRALSDADRLLIRKRNQEHPPSHQNDLITWFYEKTGHQINQSIVSKVLSTKYDYLDPLDAKKDKKQLNTKRSSTGEWPDLEAALCE